MWRVSFGRDTLFFKSFQCCLGTLKGVNILLWVLRGRVSQVLWFPLLARDLSIENNWLNLQVTTSKSFMYITQITLWILPIFRSRVFSPDEDMLDPTCETMPKSRSERIVAHMVGSKKRLINVSSRLVPCQKDYHLWFSTSPLTFNYEFFWHDFCCSASPDCQWLHCDPFKPGKLPSKYQ